MTRSALLDSSATTESPTRGEARAALGRREPMSTNDTTEHQSFDDDRDETNDRPNAELRTESAYARSVDGGTAVFCPVFAREDGGFRWQGDQLVATAGIWSETSFRNALSDLGFPSHRINAALDMRLKESACDAVRAAESMAEDDL